MQNKPNLRISKKNTTFLLAKDYEQITVNNEPEKQTQSKPILPASLSGGFIRLLPAYGGPADSNVTLSK
jgi:hypothetical protein